MIFKSDLNKIKKIEVVPEHKDIPQLYRSSLEFALENSKEEATLNMFKNLYDVYKNDGYKYTSIDSRTHMLMKGMYPCIPGWHCDDFYRPTNDQPDLYNIENDAPQKHYLLCIGDNSLTEFINCDLDLPDPEKLPKDNPLYFYYDKLINELLMNNKYVSEKIEQKTVYSFGPKAFHQGTPTIKNGWRTFIRVTRSNHREEKNELRYQSNVYIKGDIAW